MKPQEQRLSFVRLRAEGKSYNSISKELSISKDTCSRWEQELKDDIATFKAEQLRELYESYYMLKEARITQLGDTLNNINEALSKKDLEEISPDRLLDYKLRYMEALKEEYIELNNITPIKRDYDAKDILNTLGEVLNGLRNGTITPEQATKESQLIGNVLKAYETVELKTKLEAIETVMRGRN